MFAAKKIQKEKGQDAEPFEMDVAQVINQLAASLPRSRAALSALSASLSSLNFNKEFLAYLLPASLLHTYVRAREK